MTTRQNPLAGRYFNDPNFAAAISNLAGAFAPPSPEEYLLAEQVKGERLTNDTRNRMLGLAGDDFDKLGIVGDLYDPSNSYYSVDTEAATARRGQDVTAETALNKAVIDGTYGLAGTKLGYGDTMPGLPPEIAAAIGAPAFAPQSGAALGAPAPLMTEDQMMAAIIGQQDPETQRALLDVNTVNTVGPDGKAIISSEADSIGQEAFVNPGSTAAPTAITFDRGGVRMGGFIKDGKYYDAQGGPLSLEEAGTAAEVGKPMGTNAELGLTNSIVTERTRIDSITTESDMLVDDLKSLIQGQAGAVGLAGTLQNVAQNLVQVSNELATAFGQEDGIVTQEMLAQVLPSEGGPYDPTFAQLRAGMLQLAYLNAQRDNPSGEVSRFALERQLEALSQGLLANDQSVLAALDMTKQANARKRKAYGTAGAANDVAPAATPGAQGGNVTSSGIQWSIEP